MCKWCAMLWGCTSLAESRESIAEARSCPT